MKKTIIDTIGNTPLLPLENLTTSEEAKIYVKVESFNPGGSIKDRPALYMIQDAIKRGVLKPGMTIVESTSGNMGIALAMIGRVLGYPVVLVMPETMSVERQKLMKSYGAQLILTKGTEGMQGAVEEANRLVQEKGFFMPMQFENPANVKAHEETTAVEILQELPVVDGFVAGIGTGGTVTGIGKVLRRERNSLIWGMEPTESPLLTEGKASGHKIQGIGANFIPKIMDSKVLDKIITVKGEDAIQMARRLGREEGIGCGISSGANVCAALTMAKLLGNGKVVVTVLPDTVERYLSTELTEE